MWRKHFPGIRKFAEEHFNMAFYGAGFFLVGLGKSNGKRDAPYPKLVNKFNINLLRGVAAIYQYKQVNQVFALSDVVFNHLFPPAAAFLAYLGIPIPRQVNQVPVVGCFAVYIPAADNAKMINELGFTRFGRGFGKAFLCCKHVDEGAFSHIAATDKGKFGAVRRRALCHLGLADDVFSFQNIHIGKCNVQIFSLRIMRVVIQRVSEASVTIEGAINGSIGMGLLVLVGVEDADTSEDIEWLSRKIVQLRIFNDDVGVPNLSVQDVQGDILVVSQFTLHASTKKGNRPSYIRASKPEIAVPLYEAFVKQVSNDLGKPVATGIFGADMKVALLNDGPVTIIMDTKQKDF